MLSKFIEVNTSICILFDYIEFIMYNYALQCSQINQSITVCIVVEHAETTHSIVLTSPTVIANKNFCVKKNVRKSFYKNKSIKLYEILI